MSTSFPSLSRDSHRWGFRSSRKEGPEKRESRAAWGFDTQSGFLVSSTGIIWALIRNTES